MFICELELDINSQIDDKSKKVRFFDKSHYHIASIELQENLVCYGARCDKYEPCNDIKSALNFISKFYDFNNNVFHYDVI